MRLTSIEMNKSELIKYCISITESRITELQKQMEQMVESKENDTKSSAGDKFETSREMLQQEENNLKKQLILWGQLRRDFTSIDPSKKLNEAQFGAVVKASNGIYFLSAALGKIEFKKEKVFCISMASPMGGLLQGRSEGDEIEFNDKVIRVVEII